MLCPNCGMEIPDITPIGFKHADLCPYCRTDVSAARTFHVCEELGCYGADLIHERGCLGALWELAIDLVWVAIGLILGLALAIGISCVLGQILLWVLHLLAH